MMKDAWAYINAFLKVVQTGMFGFLLACVFICDRNAYLLMALVHGFDDFCLSLGDTFENAKSSGVSSYTAGGSQTAITYLVFIVLQIPMVVVGIKILKKYFKEMDKNNAPVIENKTEEAAAE